MEGADKRQQKGPFGLSVCAGWAAGRLNSIYKFLKMYLRFSPNLFLFFRNLSFRDTCTCAQLHVKGFHYRTTVHNCERQKQPNYPPVGQWYIQIIHHHAPLNEWHRHINSPRYIVK